MSPDIIYVSDLHDEFEELEEHEKEVTSDEYKAKAALLSELACGGDIKWRGDWYPFQLIRESHFTEFAREYAEESGLIARNAAWPHNCIDWDEAARQLLMDYSAIDIDGVTYYFRS